MRTLSFALSTLLALAGIGLASAGILAEELKMLFLGLVLIFGAGVFATLYLGTR